jgi:hypothetical protein
MIVPLARRRGLGQTDFVSGLASAIQSFEGWFPPGTPGYPSGSLSYRNNNPGNLRPGSLAVGATGSNGGYAVFPDYQTGYNALVGLIQSPMYWNLTLSQFFQTYAPSADNNNPAQYAATVAAQLGVDANTPISTLAAGGGPLAAPVAGGPCDPTSTSYDETLCGGTASSSLSDQVSDALGGISPVAIAALAGILVLAAVL